MAWVFWGVIGCLSIAFLLIIWVVAQAYADSEDADVVDEGDAPYGVVPKGSPYERYDRNVKSIQPPISRRSDGRDGL